MAPSLSAYELERQANILSNQKQLLQLGLQRIVDQAQRPSKRAAPRRAATTPLPTRKSTRRSTALPGAAESNNFATEEEVSAALDHADRLDTRPLPRANGSKRTLSAAQSAWLEQMEEGGASPLTVEEVAAVHAARRNVRGTGVGGGWKGRNTWEEKRSLLRATVGLRWPRWLDTLATSGIDLGRTAEAKHQTLYALERAACGMGLEYSRWPSGAGVLLGGLDTSEMKNVALAGLPAPSEALQREGMATELRFRQQEVERILQQKAERQRARAEALQEEQDAQDEERKEIGSTESENAGALRVESPSSSPDRSASANESVADLEEHKDVEIETPLPVGRVLTLGSDTEALRREGQRLEAKYARDRGNGWVYNHALNKLRHYQEMLLREHFNEEPNGTSIEEIEAGEVRSQ
eukprot:scaffold109069_cov31-Tisochrysis_lutea.AAC.6